MFRINHGFIRGDVEMQIALMDAPEGTQIGAEGCTGPFAAITVHLAPAIPIVVPRPLTHAMAHRGMSSMAPSIALPLVGIERRAASRDVRRDQFRAGTRVCVVADPEPLLACVPRQHTDDGRAIIGVGPVPFAFIGAPPGRISRIEMGATFVPPRFGTARRPQRRCQA